MEDAFGKRFIGGIISHSLIKIWIHAIYGTKDKTSLIKDTFESQLHHHIKEKLEKELDCKVRNINGTEDHIHILFLLSPNYSLKEIFQKIKGESSHLPAGRQVGLTNQILLIINSRGRLVMVLFLLVNQW